MRRTCLYIIVVFLFLPQPWATAQYLRSETLTFPTDGRAVETSLPLDPAHQYHVTVSSAYNLRSLLVDCEEKTRVTYGFLGVPKYDRYTICAPPILFDAQKLPTVYWLDVDGTRGSYYFQRNDSAFYIPTLDFYYWGTGKPLTLRLSTDLSGEVRGAQVEIIDQEWKNEQEAQQRLAELQAQERQKRRIRGSIIVVIGGGLVLLLVIAGRRRAQPVTPITTRKDNGDDSIEEHPSSETMPLLRPGEAWWSPEPIPADAELKVTITGSYAHQSDYDRVLHWWSDAFATYYHDVPPGQYSAHNNLFFDDNPDPAVPFRAAAHFHSYDFLYRGTGNRLMLLLDTPDPQYYNDGLSVSLSPLTAADRDLAGLPNPVDEDEVLARQEAEAEAERCREADELEAARSTRFRMIQSRYGDALFEWRNDPSVLARYARDHQHALLDPRRQRDIIDAYTDFHDDDLDFVEWMRTNHTDLYHRIDEIFYYRALALAESLATQEKPRRPKLTPEERQAKFERYRARGLERDRVQAEDRRAAVRQKLDLLQQFKDDMDAYDLEEDERERYIKEFEDDLFTPTEENANGSTFKTV